MKPRILVVDDDKAVRTALSVNLGRMGMEVSTQNSAKGALDHLRRHDVDLVLTDVRMPGASGLELLEAVRARWPELPVVVMTGYGSVDDAVAAMKAGAAEYLIKPVEKDALALILERALDRRRLESELAHLRAEVQSRYGFENIIGATPAMQRLYEDVSAVADTSATVLLQGPTGTGKELLAHAIHYRSPRSGGPFVRVNCAAIPESLLESELFGHERGAFSGAIRQHRGKFEQADGGTILLDEIGEIDPHVQVKLLRVLENGELQRVGGSETLQVDTRVVAATNRDLREEAREGRFREDLFYRLNVVTIRVPSLAERRDDIPLLVEHFAKHYAQKNNRPEPRIDPADLSVLMTYDWPGNVRQLEHVVERAVILCREGDLKLRLPDDPPTHERAPAAPTEAELLPPLGTTLQEAIAAHERRILIAALKASDGVQARAARRLGLSRSNLNYRINRLGIQVKDITYD